MSDVVDVMVGQWAEQRPELADGMWPLQLLSRVQRMGQILTKEIKAFAAERGLEQAEVDVLFTLRRSGPPYALTAGAFLKASMVTSGAITNRIDRMEAKGLVERIRDTADRRTVRISLTDRGLQLADDLIADHLVNYARICEALDRDECEQAGATLRKLLEAQGDTSLA
ncbi:MarR family transcriptional regulator [Streptomyces triticagri]|uniref:MarR family transcriptional regulator n=1 Tax=Streptomyces triticagri TaxID=2293568 RepID=A0A372M6F2_9ACTN|nr:MarR family transcriptional regulator [Streptomyces triticagri]RFU86524.1 MarR family transcriptional regulator [Streptomyces triticagri]